MRARTQDEDRTSATKGRRRRRHALVFGACALVGGAVAWTVPALAYARHISAWGCLPLSAPLSTAGYTVTNQYGSSTELGFYCPFTYDTTFLDSQVNTVRVDSNQNNGSYTVANACYVAYDGSSSGCGASAYTTGSNGAYGAPSASPSLWKQDPDKKVGSRYTFVAVWIGGGNLLNGVYVTN